jgi:hypothetical protein
VEEPFRHLRPEELVEDPDGGDAKGVSEIVTGMEETTRTALFQKVAR